MTDPAMNRPDEAASKGATEDDSARAEQTSLAGQLGHRDQDKMLKDNDSDFPEPDAKAEHSGE